MVTIGIDEVGRGCWAGPLLAGAVVIDPDKPIARLQDSKKLNKLRRQRLSREIHDKALAYGIGWVWPAAIDQYGLTWAVSAAMAAACDQVVYALRTRDPDMAESIHILIDGNYNYLPTYPRVTTQVRADALDTAVSAASIIAKVSRDDYMSTVAAQLYPEYGFQSHVGYGTAQHSNMLQKYGVTAIHRRSYKPISMLLK